MVKLTADLIQTTMQYINPVKDRELDLRGYKIPEIENLGATGDQFDTLDLSDNDIRKLDGFPYLKRLKCLLLNNNRIVRISPHLEDYIPNMETVILTGNHIAELSDLDPLISLENLTTISLLHNPVIAKPYYRLYVAFKIPQVKLLDFRKIKLKERQEATQFFKSTKGKDVLKDVANKAKSFVAGGTAINAAKRHTDQETKKIREAIAKATSLEDVDRLHRLLQSGQIPDMNGQNGSYHVDQSSMDMDV